MWYILVDAPSGHLPSGSQAWSSNPQGQAHFLWVHLEVNIVQPVGRHQKHNHQNHQTRHSHNYSKININEHNYSYSDDHSDSHDHDDNHNNATTGKTIRPIMTMIAPMIIRLILLVTIMTWWHINSNDTNTNDNNETHHPHHHPHPHPRSRTLRLSMEKEQHQQEVQDLQRSYDLVLQQLEELQDAKLPAAILGQLFIFPLISRRMELWRCEKMMTMSVIGKLLNTNSNLESRWI